MESTAETYRTAALEHLANAELQHERGEYVFAHYSSGLAVECYLRAFLRLQSDVFDSRHDLERLGRAYLDAAVPRHRRDEFEDDLDEINERWRSNHRYYSERQVLTHLNGIKADFGLKGERWKNLSRTLLDIARKIVKQGESQWKQL